MKKLSILNLFGGLGGNRRLWDEIPGYELDITCVEYKKEIADIYHDFFPKDKIVIADAHQYLLEHHKEYDFIFSSPPCQSHSSFRHNICVRFRGTEPVYPDMMLYQEILFLKHHFAGSWVVENVNPYYAPLIEPTKALQRHLFWCNFEIKNMEFKKDKIRTAQIPQLSEIHGFDLSKYKLTNKRQVLRNCVLPELGLHILQCALNLNKQKTLP